ncbi:MAG: nucleoside triphosphate pyrophosphohydrolase [Bacillota bacterium]
MLKILVMGLGPGELEMLPSKNLQLLKGNYHVFVRTAKHPVVKQLENLGVKFHSFDEFYQTHETFEEVYHSIVDTLIDSVQTTKETIVYAVPGHPMVAESSVKMLLVQAAGKNIPVEILPAPSCLEAVYAALQIDPCDGLIIADALKFDERILTSGQALLFTQVYSKMAASDLKLTLMDVFKDDHQVTVVKGAGIPAIQRIELIPLHELDRLGWIDHMTSVYVQPPEAEAESIASKYSFEDFLGIMDKLRSPTGCPWDRKQTHQSLKKFLLEETYEVLEAIDEENMHKLLEELGDLLLQVVFHAQLASEKGVFDVYDVIHEISSKLLRRHPHVFGSMYLKTSGEVELTWEKIKAEEKNNKSVLDGVLKVFPALSRAEKLQKKAARVGFDWPDITGPWEKVQEEIDELKKACQSRQNDKISEEMGDLLFALVNVCRFLNIDPEESLQKANNKFIKRFLYVEEQIKEKNLQWGELNLQNMDILWEEAKKKY